MKLQRATLRPLLALVLVIAYSIATPARTAGPDGRRQAPAAPALPTGVERVTSVEGITEYRLRNGLRVLLFPDPTKETITVNITYLVGSRTRTTARRAWPTCSSTWCSRARRSTRTFRRS